MEKIIYSCLKTLGFITFLFINSCIVAPHKEMILERSQKDRPEWAQDNWQEESDAESIKLIFKKTGIYNLNLGLKQAQSSAVLQTSYLIMSNIQKSLLKKLSSSSKISDKERNSILKELYQITNYRKIALKSQPALPKDIYWEYQQKDTDNSSERFYTVWVLLSVSKTDYESALTATALSLTKSGYSDIVVLGQSILQQITPSK